MINFGKEIQIAVVIGLVSQAAMAEPLPTEKAVAERATTGGALTGQVFEQKTKPLNGIISKSEPQKLGSALKGVTQKSDLSVPLQAQQPGTQDGNVNEPELRIKTSRNVNEPELNSQTPLASGLNERNGTNNQSGVNETGGVNEPNGDNNQSGSNN